jgi:adenine phosphoribosyltransferase|tara:strand:+ start:84 stop:599 length:516 start_codon:yes stop_codon:yes gene_type:complete
MNKYKKYITEVPDFPEEGISFKDISPLLKHGNVYRLALMDMLQGHNNDLWAGVESRGFLIASGLSQLNGGGVLMIRKPGKLPPPIAHKRYFLEYGQDALEVQLNTEESTKTVVLVDDVLATGGTLKASYELLNNNGYEVLGISVLIDLQYLHEKDFSIDDHKVSSVIQYVG